MFDECLNFRPHVQKLIDKSASRLNIIRILSHKYWKLEKKTLISIIIGSVLDYSSFISSGLSDELTGALQAVQNGESNLLCPQERPHIYRHAMLDDQLGQSEHQDGGNQ